MCYCAILCLFHIVLSSIKKIHLYLISSLLSWLNFSYKKEIINQNPFEYLYGQDLKKARDEFEKIYFQHHIKNNLSIKELSEISGIERTHLYRKLKQLGIKNS